MLPDKVPLGDISRLYRDDPQAGLKVLAGYFPAGTKVRVDRSGSAWVHRIVLQDGLTVVRAEYFEPSEDGLTMAEFEAAKARAIDAWFSSLLAQTTAYTMTGWTSDPPRVSVSPVNPIKVALAEARSVPEPIASVARADAGDRLLSALKARRNGTP